MDCDEDMVILLFHVRQGILSPLVNRCIIMQKVDNLGTRAYHTLLSLFESG